MRTSSLRPWFLAVGVCLSLAGRADAQELDDQTRSAARELATEGSALYQQSDFEGAYDRFNRAFQLVQKPNVGIWAARSLQRAGRWVEASERFLELERMSLPEGSPPDLTDAQRASVRALSENAPPAVRERLKQLAVRWSDAEMSGWFD